MAEQTGKTPGWVKYAIIIGIIVFVLIAIVAAAFVFFVPTWFAGEEGFNEMIAPDIPEVLLRVAIVGVAVIIGLVFAAGIIFVLWEMFFKKKELHIVKEHHKIISETTQLNPVHTMRNLVLTGQNKIQSYILGKIVGHTQIPIKFERFLFIDENGKIDEALSETQTDFDARKAESQAAGKDRYDFFAFLSQKGVYALPFFAMLEPVKIFACYPTERTPDLLGDVEVYDVGTWKISGVNLFIPGQRSQEPMSTIKEIEGQLMPIAYMNLIDYIGLTAQRGIEGDTSMQKWLQAKASTVNVKENA